MLYDELVSIYKKEYNQVFESKDKEWSLKDNCKNLEDLDYVPPDELKPVELKSNELKLPKWVKVSNERFNEIQSIITEAQKNK